MTGFTKRGKSKEIGSRSSFFSQFPGLVARTKNLREREESSSSFQTDRKCKRSQVFILLTHLQATITLAQWGLDGTYISIRLQMDISTAGGISTKKDEWYGSLAELSGTRKNCIFHYSKYIRLYSFHLVLFSRFVLVTVSFFSVLLDKHGKRNSNRGDSDETITAGVLAGPVGVCLPFLAFLVRLDAGKTSRRRRTEQPLLELRLLPLPPASPASPALSCPSKPLPLLFQPLPLLAKLGFDKARRSGWTTRCFGIFGDRTLPNSNTQNNRIFIFSLYNDPTQLQSRK